MPFGNRRLLHCVPAGTHPDAHEVPAWEACGKVIKKEQRDFYEFVVSFVVSHARTSWWSGWRLGMISL